MYRLAFTQVKHLNYFCIGPVVVSVYIQHIYNVYVQTMHTNIYAYMYMYMYVQMYSYRSLECNVKSNVT